MAEPDHDRFVTITYFVREMLGLKSKNWYYDHMRDPGMPQRVPVGGKPKLSFKDCVAYQNRLKRQAEPPEPLKRKRGRPRKVMTQAAA